MAVLTGISGIQVGDGAGGKVALELQKRVLRILSDANFTYLFASYNNPGQTNSGTISYYTPEILASYSYTSTKGGKGTDPQVPQIGLTSVNVDIRRNVRYEVETFDMSRLGEIGNSALDQIAGALALQIQADMNAQFWMKLRNWFAQKGATANVPGTTDPYQVELQYLGSNITYTDQTSNNVYGELFKLNTLYAKIGQTFDKRHIGIDKADMFAIVSPMFDAVAPMAFRNQFEIGKWQISKTLAGKQIFNIRYIVENMLDTNVAIGKSFNGDYALNLTNVIGLIAHNEAIAFPMNLNSIIPATNPNNGNVIFIAKYQFGFGILRPNLIRLLVRQGQKIAIEVPTENQTT